MKTVIIVASLAIAPSIAIAGQPDNPGGFGEARAAYVQSMQENMDAPGASEWGKLAAERAGTNGDQNRTSKTNKGGDPNPTNDNGGGND